MQFDRFINSKINLRQYKGHKILKNKKLLQLEKSMLSCSFQYLYCMIYCVDVVKLCLINFHDTFEAYSKLVLRKTSNIKHKLTTSVFDSSTSVIVRYLTIQIKMTCRRAWQLLTFQTHNLRNTNNLASILNWYVLSLIKCVNNLFEANCYYKTSMCIIIL